MYKDKNIFVFGMARSGFEVAKLLLERGNKVLITDAKEQDEDNVQLLKDLGADVIITLNPEELLTDKFDLMVKNPGIRSDHKCVLKAKSLNIKVINEMEVTYNLLPEDVKIVGVTGTNGKTTTTTLIYRFLKGAGLKTHLGGNIGIPFAKILKDIKKGDIVVLEVSIQQLFDLDKFRPNIGIITNLTGTHLDLCKTIENYILLKLKMFRNCTNRDLAIINEKNKNIVDVIPPKIYFSSKENSDICIFNEAIYYKEEEIIKLHDIRIKGSHNYENIMGAIAVAKEFNIKTETIQEVLNNFSGVSHRLEFVLRLNNREFYNDSKSTNITSTIVAINSFDKPIILLLGGLDRGHSFDNLKGYLTNVKGIVAFGQTKERIKQFADLNNIECILVDKISDAVKVSYNLSNEGDIILLSPACASWDQYPDFEVRGEDFKKEVEKLLETKN